MADEDRWIDLSAGDEFAGYRIERRLGRGGMGVLYLAVEPGLERRVALKLIAPEAAADEVFARRFAEESKIAASIEHPNVVPIYAAGEEGGVPYIAMRYVSGSDLGRRIAREGRLEPAGAAALIAQIGNGLDAIHAAGLIHRDVKPANVLLGGGEGAEHAYITDFGVARNVATESGLTQTGRFVGTLDYVAPEQISGAPVDARADVYALGCLLFKLLTGEVPFPREAEAARLYAHLNEPPPAPSLHAARVPMALDDVVARAMSKPPGDRYPSAGDLGRAAEAALRGERPTVPERTVATGAAATREAETIPATGPEGGQGAKTGSRGAVGEAGEEPAPTGFLDEPPAPPTAATRRLGVEAKPAGAGAASRRRLILAGGAALAVAAIVAGAIALGDGEEGGKPGGAAAAARNGTAKQGGGGSGSNPAASEPLSKSELIRRADATCEDSQGTYLATLQDFPEGETTPDVTYSKTLTGISTRAVRRFNSLTPPAGVRRSYGEYVRAQERVKAYDRQALRAAEAEDVAAYLAARERRDDEQRERYELARAVGLETCSANPG